MKTIRVHELGGPGVLKHEDTRAPTPGPGRALVRVEAIGLNFIDCFCDDGPI